LLEYPEQLVEYQNTKKPIQKKDKLAKEGITRITV